MATPLIKINERLYAKLETYQPTGSVKDRMIKYLVNAAINEGSIIPGKTSLVEATSGNTGISLASIAAQLGCTCTIVMPRNMSLQRKQMMKAFGAHIIETSDNDFMGAIALRDELVENSDNVWCPYQFENKRNIECHFQTTAKEIHNQVLERNLNWTTFVHGAGTGGTMMGIKKYIDYNHLNVQCVLTVPAESAKEHGIQGINDGDDFLLDKSQMSDVISVQTDAAINRMKKFARESGLLVGISSGANLAAAEKYLETHNTDGIIITMLCDRGERYLSQEGL
jgi:cysteine synthase A